MDTFEQMGLQPEILKALADLKFVTPTLIQQEAIPMLIKAPQDMIGYAQTGTGKTAAFGLSIIHHTDPNVRLTQSIVLCPTRELCVQVTKDLQSFTKYQRGLNVVAVYGGESIDRQIRALRKGAQIVVGTPGRTLDLIRRKLLNLSKVDWLVLDEADEMLSMGFKEELDAILEETPDEKNTLLFSATMPRGIKRMANEYMFEPAEINIGKRNTGAENVHHAFYVVKRDYRYQALKRIADIHPDIYGIVFCRTRLETKEIAEMLLADNYNADALHGDMSQVQRDMVMNRFRTKHLQILVATDVAARGLDINDLTHVINFNLPDQLESYIHRSGRTGRAGKSGTSIAIIPSRAIRKIYDLERKINKKFEQRHIPTGAEICEKRLYNMIEKVKNVEVNEAQIGIFMDKIYEQMSEMSREDLIKHFVSVEFNRFLADYKHAPDLNQRAVKNKKDFGDRSGRSGNKMKFTRFFLNVGNKQKLSPVRLIGMINDYTNNSGIEIGKIEIQKNFTFFEVDSAFQKQLLTAFSKANFEGIPLVIDVARPKSDNDRGGGNSRGGRRDSGGSGRFFDKKQKKRKKWKFA